MESENEASDAGTPPAVCIDDKGAVEQSNLHAVEGIHSTSNMPNWVGGDDEKAPEEVPRSFSGHSELHFGDFPDVEHKNLEMELLLLEAKERIEKLRSDLANAEKKLADSQKEHSEEIFFLQRELQSFTSIGEDKVKSLESENARLVAELNASKGKVSDLKMHLQNAKQYHGELVSQVDGFKETVHMLEKQLVDLNEQTRETKGNLSEQVEACQAELATKTEALQGISKSHSALQLELQEVKSKSQESANMMKEQVFTLEGMLESAQDAFEANKVAASLLQAENANLKSNLSKLSTASKEKLKQLEEEHEEQIKAHEDRCEALQKSLLKLEERSLQLQVSLGTARSDREVARGKIADLELELKSVLQSKRTFEEGAAELQVQLKTMEEMVSKQVESLKVAEENADTAREQVVHLQSMLKTTEEKLRASEEAAGNFQQQVAELTSKEARSTEHLQEVEDCSQKMQLAFQSKLERLEEKVAQLQDSLSAALLDGDGARKNVTELEVELTSLQQNQGELVKKVRFFEEKCFQDESTANDMSMRVVELEELITEYKTKLEALNGKLVTEAAALGNSQKKVTDLEMQLRLAEDNSLMLENRSAADIAALEKSSEGYAVKIEELHTLLAERQHEINSVTNIINELKMSIGALESDLKGASEREMLANKERTSVEEKLAKLGALTAKLEVERSELESSMSQQKSLVEKEKIALQEAFVLEKKLKHEITTLQAAMSGLQDLLIQTEEEKQARTAQLVEERQELQRQIATIMEENEDLRQKMASAQEKLHVTLAGAELSAKQVQEGCLKESILRDQVEDLNLRLKKAHAASAHIETLEQEKGKLAQQFANEQEKLNATLEAAELSARELQAALLRGSILNAEIEDLKVQLGKAMDACSHVERLEQSLENSITREDHQAQIYQILAASRQAESKLAEVEEQLLKSRLEIKGAQKVVSEQETLLKDSDSRTVKSMESFDSTKTREINLDHPGKVRNRKKKAVTWETDATVIKPKEVHKPQQHPVQRLHHYTAHLFIALVSLTIGFWLARKVHA